MSKVKKMELSRSKSGTPCLWEAGGGYSNTGKSQIIAGKNGEAKQPIYIRRRGELACCEHALIPISVGDYVISASHHRGDFEIFVYRITKILEEASTEKIAEFSNGEWDAELPAYLQAAVEAAKEKATCYHCREPHFIKRGRIKKEGFKMIRIINKYTFEDVKEKIDRDDLIVTNDLTDDTADIRIIATDEEFKNASNYSLLNHFERY